MMDKKTLWVVIACILALFTWQWAIDKLFPGKPKPVIPPVSSIETNAVPAAVTGAVEKAVEAVAPAPPVPAAPRPAEQVAVLSNELVRVEITSWGGGIRSVELLKHKANGRGNVVLNGAGLTPALTLANLPDLGAGAAYQLRQVDERTVELRATSRAGVSVTKRLALGPDYSAAGSVEVTGTTNAIELTLGTVAPVTLREQNSYLGADWYVNGKCRYHNAGHLQKREKKNENREQALVRWAAVKSQFFAAVLTPATNATAITTGTTLLPRPESWKDRESPMGLTLSVELAPATATNGVTQYAFSFYAGPKEYERLAALGKGQEELMQFGDTVFSFWGTISVALLKTMKFCYRLLPNYGIAIIIVTVLVKLVFWPIQAKSIKSMKQMQKFQPLMAKLKEKYKDDAQRQNQEMMKLYKEHKINPMAGCLPMVVQIPVFVGLYRMLQSAIELRGAHFLYIRDLSQPDTILNIAGLPVNPLPLLMVGSMIWQQKITPSTADSQQQKMMMFMPLMMLFFFYNVSSGLTLYWTVQQFLSIGQQWWSMRQPSDGDTGAPVLAGKVK